MSVLLFGVWCVLIYIYFAGCFSSVLAVVVGGVDVDVVVASFVIAGYLY